MRNIPENLKLFFATFVKLLLKGTNQPGLNNSTNSSFILLTFLPLLASLPFIIVSFWFIWNERNLLTFEESKPLAMSVIIKTQALSLVGTLKSNSDASYNPQTGKASGAFLFRDCRGALQTGSAFNLCASSSLVAETLALREAMSCAVNLNITEEVVFESDSLELVNACRSTSTTGEIAHLLIDISVLASNFHKCGGFVWTAREGNCVAHQAAKMQARGSLPPNCMHSRSFVNRDENITLIYEILFPCSFAFDLEWMGILTHLLLPLSLVTARFCSFLLHDVNGLYLIRE